VVASRPVLQFDNIVCGTPDSPEAPSAIWMGAGSLGPLKKWRHGFNLLLGQFPPCPIASRLPSQVRVEASGPI